MRPLLMVCEGCGARVRTARPELARTRACPRCATSLATAVIQESTPSPIVDRPGDLLASTPSKPETKPVTEGDPILTPELSEWYRQGRRRHLVRDTLAPLFLLALLLATGYYWFQASGIWQEPAHPDRNSHSPGPESAAAPTSTLTPDQLRFAERAARVSMPANLEFQGDFEDAQTNEPEASTSNQAVSASRPPIPSTPTEQAIRDHLESVPKPIAVPLPDSVSVFKPPNTTAHEPPATPHSTLTASQPEPEGLPAFPSPSIPGPRRILVADQETGRPLVSRIYAEHDGQIVVQLPDGSLGWPSARVETDQPFRPWSQDQVQEALRDGPYRGLQVVASDHYLVFFNCSEPFANASLTLLEKLYHNLKSSLEARGFDLHEPEFPLVAVIFRDEAEFRAHRPIESDVQAYYEIYSNHIFLYETSERDQMAPELAARKKPQTIAHEGTHQILQNIGIQPRLASWPLWLVEGLAEYCAPAANRPDGLAERFGQVNPFHMATLIDLRNPRALLAHIQGTEAPTVRIGRDPRIPWIEYLVSRTELSPTDYALAWALTHYLATHRFEEFMAYLEQVGKLAPLEPRSPTQHLEDFRSAFGEDLNQLTRQITRHLNSLKYEQIPYYAVVFEQSMGFGLSRRGGLVSQSPTMIRQWLNTLTSNEGGPPQWRAYPYPSQAQAKIAVQAWIEAH